MNTTIRRIAICAPMAVALVGFSMSATQAAPYQPNLSDSVHVQPVADKPDVVINPDWDINPDNFDDAPDVPVDPDPAPDGPDDVAPAPDDADDSDDDSDDNSNGGKGGHSGSTGGNSVPKADSTEETSEATSDDTEVAAADVAEVADVDSPFPTGVVILGVVGLLLGLAAWFSYRAGNKTA